MIPKPSACESPTASAVGDECHAGCVERAEGVAASTVSAAIGYGSLATGEGDGDRDRGGERGADRARPAPPVGEAAEEVDDHLEQAGGEEDGPDRNRVKPPSSSWSGTSTTSIPKRGRAAC